MPNLKNQQKSKRRKKRKKKTEIKGFAIQTEVSQTLEHHCKLILKIKNDFIQFN